jgi:thiamine-phosphate pyrophosphorylase
MTVEGVFDKTGVHGPAAIRGPAAVRGLYPIIDLSIVGPDHAERLAGEILAANGVTVMQLRAKEASAASALRAAQALRRLTSSAGALFIVNDRCDIALASGADGVHLGDSDLAIEDARALLGRLAIIGASTHGVEEAERAERDGADYISLGPVFATRTKKDALSPRGLACLRDVKRAVKVPVAAIGGITEETLPEVIRCGADAVAMISEIALAKDPGAKTRRLLSIFGMRPALQLP